MSQSIIDTNVIQKSFDEGFGWGINLVVSTVVNVVKNFLFSNWRYILLFFAVLGAGMILQILMLREGRHNKLPAWFNSLVGSVFYFIFLVLITAAAYLVFGSDVIDESWIGLFGTVAFFVNWLFLRSIGFWYY